jgi:hypothetical protein
MLHLHNGDSSANILKESGLPGEHVAWREALISGPTPQNFSADEWRRVRAAHLAEAYALKPETVMHNLAEQERALSEFSRHREVVLWFEHDLFCQLHLVYLLQWFAGQKPCQTKLSLICIDSFPGVDDFRGLGQLSPQQMASLFAARREVSDEQLKLAVAAWQAYCAPTPLTLQQLTDNETLALPLLKNSLCAHLARFPSTLNGLGRIEQQALSLIKDGNGEFKGLFQEFGARQSIYGLGDFQFWNELQRLTRAQTPLLVMSETDAEGTLASGAFLKTVFELTPEGALVLEGKEDFVELNGIDLWLGGVHLDGKENPWRWNEGSERLERS